jgi:ferritin-like metal-binding protein YciE
MERTSLALLPHLARGSFSPELRRVFEVHLRETRHQVERLDEAFRDLGIVPGEEVSPAMEGLLGEHRELLEGGVPSSLRDAALIGVAQCVEHHEIAEYGTCRTYAQELGFQHTANLLDETLREEAAADERLTLVAEGGLFHSGINARAHEAAAEV